MRIVRRRGTIRMQLEPVESALLDTLLDDLDGALATLPADDPVRQRLFPAGYQDEDAAAEFRELTESSLRDVKAVRLGQCRAELPAGAGTVELSADETERWLTVLNDLRLAIGTRLEITEEEPLEVDPASADAQTRGIYHWLTALQDALVSAAMR